MSTRPAGGCDADREGAVKALRGVGFDDGWDARVHDRVRHRVDARLRRIRHLVDTDYEVHGVSLGSNQTWLSACVSSKPQPSQPLK